MKPTGEQAARLFIDHWYPDCCIAILAGSAAQGRENDYSDLDLVIMDETVPRPYRRTYREFGRTIEAFVLNRASCPALFMVGITTVLPSLQRMVAEGVVLKDDGTAAEIREQARNDLAAGPFPWMEEEKEAARYRISEYLEDLSGSSDRGENLFIVQQLAELVTEFVLRANNQWLGEGKWALRMLQRYDASFSRSLIACLEDFYVRNDRRSLVRLVDNVLEPWGGRLAEGHIIYADADLEEGEGWGG
ncbi:nucleotidyltransferase domain-containing protein [Paenibacillus sp. J2TS4]|uniref:nucleotidyltransferase domain-containing protein n=1 Tax=Paenibacillus sp. J2TS4 TaxID=2807194 RepID=UPI001B26448C|nr:nucleotidyltransferase domain-containing protein [Paenibacillus sp. J2TS4]GIP35281.1 hypothetical protein J2TS4_44910 [Paenibacillus sp. J2TS4]